MKATIKLRGIPTLPSIPSSKKIKIKLHKHSCRQEEVKLSRAFYVFYSNFITFKFKESVK